MSIIVFHSVRLDLYSLSAVRIEYPTINSYYSLIPNRHLAMAINPPNGNATVINVMTGTPTNVAEGLIAWAMVAKSNEDARCVIDAQPRDIAWITIGYEDFKEHWFIPQL
jgi:hypothetical protein